MRIYREFSEKNQAKNDAMNPQQNVVNQPKLLMSDVSYMRAGATCAIALKKNGEAYWWGEFMSGEVSITVKER